MELQAVQMKQNETQKDEWASKMKYQQTNKQPWKGIICLHYLCH